MKIRNIEILEFLLLRINKMIKIRKNYIPEVYIESFSNLI